MKKALPLALGAAFCALLLFLAPAPAAAQSVLSHAIPGYNGNEQTVFAPSYMEATTSRVKNLGLYTDNWSFSGDVSGQGRRLENHIIYAYARFYSEENFLPEGAKEDGSPLFNGSTTITLDYESRPVSIEGFKTLRLGISLDSFSPDGKFTGASLAAFYPVSITLVTDQGDSFTSSLDVKGGGWSLLSLDVRPLYGKGVITSITLTVSYDRQHVPGYFCVSSPYTEDVLPYALNTADRYCASQLLSGVGTVSSASGKVRPDNDTAEITGVILTTAKLDGKNPVSLYLRLAGIRSGTLRIAFSGPGGSISTGKITLNSSMESEQLLVVPLTIPRDATTYNLLFEDVDCDRFFTLESLSIPDHVPTPRAGDNQVGVLTSLKRSGGSLLFEGTLSRDAVRKHAGSSIGFFALPSATVDDLSTAISLGSVKISTAFTYSVDIASLADLADTYLFFAAICVPEKDGSLCYEPLSRPRYPDANLSDPVSLSPIGLTGSASVGVFESGASHVIVDVPLDKLLTTEGSTYLTYTDYEKERETSTRRIHLSRDFLKSLDRDVSFYISSGTKVYLRLYASHPMEGFTYENTAEAYMPDFSRPGVKNLWAALIRHLSQRYEGLAGFTLGFGANDPTCTGLGALAGGSDEEYASYIAALAEMCRVTYNAADSASMRILLPLRTSLTAEEGFPLTPFVSLLSQRLEILGSVPLTWQIHLTAENEGASFGDFSECFNELDAMRRTAGEAGISLPTRYAYLWQPDETDLRSAYEAYARYVLEDSALSYSAYAAELFGQIAEDCSRNRGVAVFAALDNTDLVNDHAFYAALKAMNTQKGYVYDAEATFSSLPQSAVHTLFDFSKAFYSKGWIPGGGVASCTTEKSDRFTREDGYTRVLRSVFQTEEEVSDGVAGLALRNLSRSYDMTGVDAMEFTFSVELPREEKRPVSDGMATVVLVIGSADHRAEYHASVPLGQIVTLSCDLTAYEYRHQVDYVGIMLYAQTDVMLDLSTLRLGSDTMTEEQLTQMFAPLTEESTPLPAGTIALILLLIAAFSTVAVLFFLRRDHEEKQARLLKNAKIRRKTDARR